MSTFGNLFQVTTFGESHCYGVGCIVTGVPPRMRLSADDIQTQLNRRRPGQSKLTTQRNEKDQALIMSGVEFGYTLGTPIAVLVRNEDQRPGDYGGSSHMHDIPRPSHADYTYQEKYGIRASSGGGRASARETIGRVIAGAVAEKWLEERYTPNASIHEKFSIVAYVSSVANIHAPEFTDQQHHELTRDIVDMNLARCPDADTANRMIQAITEAKASHDSLGGTITCVIKNPPAGLGEPTFDKLQATLAHAMLSIPATKGFEYGSGFKGTEMRGSTHNDLFQKHQRDIQTQDIPNDNNTDDHVNNSTSSSSSKQSTRLRTVTNRSGGIQGGISNGENITFRVAFKPPATIGISQNTADFDGIPRELKAEGRHDPCVLPRAVPIVEAMAALVIADAAMIQLARENAASAYPSMSRVNPRDLYANSTLTGGFSEKEILEQQQQQQQVTPQIPGTSNGTTRTASQAQL